MPNEKTERPVMNPAFDYTPGYMIAWDVGLNSNLQAFVKKDCR